MQSAAFNISKFMLEASARKVFFVDQSTEFFKYYVLPAPDFVVSTHNKSKSLCCESLLSRAFDIFSDECEELNFDLFKLHLLFFSDMFDPQNLRIIKQFTKKLPKVSSKYLSSCFHLFPEVQVFLFELPPPESRI